MKRQVPARDAKPAGIFFIMKNGPLRKFPWRVIVKLSLMMIAPSGSGLSFSNLAYPAASGLP